MPLNGKKINWYVCGPTVYSKSHLGHAKAYISGDLIRRILVNYFHYDVTQVMNITDIDDKIINMSNELNEEFDLFAKRNESEFWRDMAKLNITLPDEIVRVSEYIPDIVEYIQKIIDNGYAYESLGSVYFSIPDFTKDQKFFYGKLDPSAIDNEELLKEGEGSLIVENPHAKKSPKDFVLWKASKPGEPKWPSPWGEGRPGWHVECSAMAHCAFKGQNPLDIHSGGIDLKFPHHENELAQSEGYYNKRQWVNYFLHYGHLHIDGCKMARSLKNFTTIEELLKHQSGRKIRQLFVMHQYDAEMNYFPDTAWEHVDAKDKFIKEWFLSVNAATRKGYNVNINHKFNDEDRELQKLFLAAKVKVDTFLLKNFATPGVMSELHELMSSVNKYLKRDETSMKVNLLLDIYRFVSHIFDCFGLEYEGKQTSGAETVGPLMDIFASYRDEVRQAAKNKDTSNILNICDKVRDENLPEVGIRLEDLGDKPAVWKFQKKEDILEDRRLKKEVAEEKLRKKEEEKLRKAKEQDEKDRQNPREMFLKMKDYSKFDEEGIPTHNAEGKELAKKARAKIEGVWKKQDEKYQKWAAANGVGEKKEE